MMLENGAKTMKKNISKQVQQQQNKNKRMTYLILRKQQESLVGKPKNQENQKLLN